MLFKMRYRTAQGIVLSRTGADMMLLAAQCDGTIIAIYSWSAQFQWTKVYDFKEIALPILG